MWDKGFGMYDFLYRVPMIFRHPSLTARTSDAFVSLLDLAPTFLEAAGRAPGEQLDGHSLLPLVRGERESVRGDILIGEAFGHQIPFWQRMVRSRTWKYIYTPTDRDEWYNLAADPHEMHNLIDEVDPALLAEARRTLYEHIEATGDPLRGMARHALV